MTDICLVCMPYTALNRPSLGLGLLQAALEEGGISAHTLYPHLWFADEIGLEVYEAINLGQPEFLLGEWTFSAAAFPKHNPDREAYSRLIMGSIHNRELERSLPSGMKLPRILEEVSRKAVGFVDRVAEAVLHMRPRIVGASSTDSQHCASLALLRRIKELDPEVITMMGGANCEAVMGQTTKREFPWVDLVVSGEADSFIADLCESLLAQGLDVGPEDLPYGVITPANASATEAPRAITPDLNQLLIPKYDLYFKALRELGWDHKLQPQFMFETSRGCWWGKCAFCSLNGALENYRSKSPERAASEMRRLAQSYGVTEFSMTDNVIDMSYFDTLLPELTNSGESFSLFYEVRPNLGRKDLQKLRQAGVEHIQAGIESLNDEFLQSILKGNLAVENLQFMKFALEAGVSLHWFFLWGAPGEDDGWYSEMAEWLPWISHMQPPLVWRIQYRRFSQYHERQPDFGLHLLPHEAYSFVYPLDSACLADLAYYFEDEGMTSIAEELKARSGLRALMTRIAEWRDLWSGFSFGSGAPVELRAHVEGEVVRIRDTRPCALDWDFRLSPVASAILRACDEMTLPEELSPSLEAKYGLKTSPQEIEAALAELTECKILKSLTGRLLSLATWA